MKSTQLVVLSALCLVVLFFACKDKTKETAPKSICDDKNIIIEVITVVPSKCVTNGSILVKTKGSSGFTYQLNDGKFQADSNFSKLAAGTYKVTVKDKDGCLKSENIVLTENGTNGPNFTAVTALIAAKCNGSFCHGTGAGGAPIGIMNTDCKIAELGPTIKIKAVNEGMGSLSSGDKAKITNWINAGGKTTD